MEDNLNFLIGGRQPHFIGKWKMTLIFIKWKMTLIFIKWKMTLIFWQMEDDPIWQMEDNLNL
jgi:hypothetical protein